MPDLIEITDEERAQLEHAAELLEGALSSPTGWINSTAMLAYDTLRDLATRKPVEPRATDPRIIMLSDEPRPFKADPGDGEVVVRLTREEAKWAAARLEPHSHNEHERAASRKLRATLDQGGSDE